MSWSGGTEIFDTVINEIYKHKEITYAIRKSIIIKLLDVLEGQDWDNVCESDYFNNSLVNLIVKEKHPNWYEEEEYED